MTLSMIMSIEHKCRECSFIMRKMNSCGIDEFFVMFVITLLNSVKIYQV